MVTIYEKEIQMSTKMKILLYEVSRRISLVEAIEAAAVLNIKDRIRRISNNEMKLEQVIKWAGCFIMDFCKHRDSGPGRAKRDREVQGFGLDKDEAFGEMTAALYDPETHFLVIQYNHYGPRPGSIGKYLSHFGNYPPVKLKPRLRDNVLAEIDRKQYVKELSFAYSAAALTEEHRKKIGMLTALNVLESMVDNIAEVKITFKAKHNIMREAASFMKKIVGINEDQEEAIKSASMKGSETLEAEPEFLNLLKATICETREGLERDEETQMYSFESRYRLLIKSFESWKRSGIITSNILR